MIRGGLNCLLKLALVGVWLPIAARAADARGIPQHLGDTGLYVAGSSSQVNPDVLPFSPQYPLWSDGAAKRRWIWLPPGTSIDASSPDAWEFPIGTRLWKEFAHGRALETRYLERAADGNWRFGSYVWNGDGSDAVLAPAGGLRDLPAPNPPGTRYTIPSEPDCRACHEGAAVPVLGFSALQLSPDRDPLAPHAESVGSVDLRALVARGWLRNLPQRIVDKPPRIAAGTPTERAALGYLHANCGHCHGKPDELGAAVPVAVLLAQSVVEPNSAADVLRSLINARSRYRPAGAQQEPQILV